MKKITFLITAFVLGFSTMYGQTVFDFDTNAEQSEDLSSIIETIDGITLTVTDLESTAAPVNFSGWKGSSGLVAVCSGHEQEFTFSEPVVVNSILALDGLGVDETYVFSTTDGEGNDPVTVSLVGGVATANLNWVGVTSFKVITTTPPSGGMVFDNLSVQSLQTLSSDNNTTIQRPAVKVYPNPVDHILNIQTSQADIESLAIYNNIGQEVLKRDHSLDRINLSHLAQGVYLLKLNTAQGAIVKRIIKK